MLVAKLRGARAGCEVTRMDHGPLSEHRSLEVQENKKLKADEACSKHSFGRRPGEGKTSGLAPISRRGLALYGRPLALRRIADRLLDKAEEGDLAAAREVIDRLDGRPVQSVDYSGAPITELTDSQLYEIAAGGLSERDVVKALPPPRSES
jgi:hypothetical protein